MKLHEECRQVDIMIDILRNAGYTLTVIAKTVNTNVSSLSRAATGEYNDLPYQKGVALENMIKKARKK